MSEFNLSKPQAWYYSKICSFTQRGFAATVHISWSPLYLTVPSPRDSQEHWCPQVFWCFQNGLLREITTLNDAQLDPTTDRVTGPDSATLIPTYNKQSHQKGELMWRAKAMLTDEQRECRSSVAHQVKMNPSLKRITIIPVLLCMEGQAPACTWVTDLQQSLHLAYKDPMFWQKPQGCLSKPTNRLHWQPHAHHCRTQKTQWAPPSGTSLKALQRDAQAQPLRKDPPRTNLHNMGPH